MGGAVARIQDMKNAYKVLVEKPERKILFSRSRGRWKDAIKVNLQKEGLRLWSARYTVHWRAVVNTAVNLEALQRVVNILTRRVARRLGSPWEVVLLSGVHTSFK
jgi:hypothetical protein